MNKITVGRTRKKSKPESGNILRVHQEASSSRAADTVLALGAAAVCVMLALPMRTLAPSEESKPLERAVMVMSTGVVGQGNPVEKEEVSAPSVREAEEWNFYDYIGELFAGLLTGQ